MDWQLKAPPWVKTEAAIENTFFPVISELMDRANLHPDDRVLDIGCGPCKTVMLAAEQVGLNGVVTGVDIARPIVEQARTRTSNLRQVNIIEGDAQSYVFPDKCYDAVLSSFEMMYFNDPDEAFANILRATKPSGRLTFVAWSDRRHNPWLARSTRTAGKSARKRPSPHPNRPGPLAFVDRRKTAKRLRNAGWIDISIEEVGLHLTPPGTSADVSKLRKVMSLNDVVNKHAKCEAEADVMAKTYRTKFARELREFDTPNGIRVPARVNFFSARRPA